MMKIPSILSQIKLTNSPSDSDPSRVQHSVYSFPADFHCLIDYQDEPCVIEIQNNMSSDFLTFNRAESISMRLKAENAELKTNMQLMAYLESCQSLIEENISKMQKNIKKIKAYYKFVVQQKNNVNK
ncbi:Hypothetical_protein [Hexamita inflata]|uniref:Hypothetical_protein n=1 Tax=Hexamita inflata TaxID=28002 RepID=A0AA86P7S2_9EUKA|nr:Hypothetical protein HINF_LOCUS20153 [Hexamita inflata]